MHKAMKYRISGAAVALWHAAERALHWALGRETHPAVLFQDGRGAIAASVDGMLKTQTAAVAIIMELDDFSQVESALTRDEQEDLLQAVAERLRPLLQSKGLIARLEGPRFGFALSDRSIPDLENAIQFATRIQHALADPIRLDGRLIPLTGSVGFAQTSRMENAAGPQLLRAAGIAQIEASRAGPHAIRSYSNSMEKRVKSRGGLLDQINAAFEASQFVAFFQPQIHLESGKVTGFEALARWQHPGRGLIPPAEFLPIIEQAGQIGRLGQTMLRQSLVALTQWDAAGLNVQQVSINFTNVELRNPGLVDHIRFELDTFDLSPQRLVVEVLETVVSISGDTMIQNNLAKLAQMGCCIDLDDFGTGHASITSIRKFAVNRIKIDRSFITDIDKDVEQQNMVSAILTMADRLGLSTLAEGVETPSEREMLRAMGCDVMQGFELARPMAFADASEWIAAQEAIYTAPSHLRRVR